MAQFIMILSILILGTICFFIIKSYIEVLKSKDIISTFSKVMIGIPVVFTIGYIVPLILKSFLIMCFL